MAYVSKNINRITLPFRLCSGPVSSGQKAQWCGSKFHNITALAQLEPSSAFEWPVFEVRTIGRLKLWSIHQYREAGLMEQRAWVDPKPEQPFDLCPGKAEI